MMLPRPDAGEVLNGLHHHQFELHYQSKASLQDGSLRGAEGLIRRRHPQYGLPSPACFLPQTEAANLVDVMAVEVVRMALQDWKRWHADGLSLPISINLSPLSLPGARLIDRAAHARTCVAAVAGEIGDGRQSDRDGHGLPIAAIGPYEML